MEPVRPNTLSTGATTAPSVIQVGTPPDIERTSPPEPVMRDILFPTFVSPFQKVRLLENEVIYPQMEARFELVIARLPERVEIFVSVVEILHEKEELVSRALRAPERRAIFCSLVVRRLNMELNTLENVF